MLPLIAVFGALIPGMALLVMQNFVREGQGIVVPVQIFFGPVAFLAYRYLRSTGLERTAGEWFAAQDAAARQPIASASAPARPRNRPADPPTQPPIADPPPAAQPPRPPAAHQLTRTAATPPAPPPTPPPPPPLPLDDGLTAEAAAADASDGAR